MKKKMSPSPSEIAQAKREAAMGDVKELVKRHGLRTIGGCLTRIRAHDQAQRRLADLKAEAARLERRLQ